MSGVSHHLPNAAIADSKRSSMRVTRENDMQICRQIQSTTKSERQTDVGAL